MAQQLINTGTFPNDQTGDPALLAFTKINNNFTQLFTGAVVLPSVVFGPPAVATPTVTVNNIAGSDSIDINVTQQPGLGFALNIKGASAGDLRGIVVTNTTAGATSGTFALTVQNDGSHTLDIGKTSTAWVGSRFTGAPAGEICWFESGGAIPISFVVNGAQAIGIAGTGAVSVAAPTSGVALTVTGAASAITAQLSAVESRLRLASSGGDNYEWISGGGSALASGIFGLFNATAGTTPITVNPAGNFSFSAPSSGDTLTVNQVTGSEGVRVACTAATGSIVARNSTNGFQLEIGNTASGAYIDASNTGLILSTQGSANPRLTIGTAGNVVINPPTSGIALSVGNTTTGVTNAQIGSMGISVGQVFGANTAELFGASGVGMNIGTTGASGLNLWTNANARIQVGATGQVTINAPSSTVTSLAVTGAANVAAGTFNGSAVSGQSQGVAILAGTTAADLCLACFTQGGTPLLFLSGTGVLTLSQVAVTSTSPVAGGAGALPATPAGYFAVTIGSTARRVPFYT